MPPCRFAATVVVLFNGAGRGRDEEIRAQNAMTGSPNPVLAVAADAHRAARADALVRISPPELLIRAVVDYAIYLIDLDGRVASWNPGAENIKGYTAGEIIGEHFSRFYTPEDRDAGVPEQALRKAVEAGRFTTEAWRCRKDGSRFWAMVVIDPVYHAGELVGFAKITRDMTEQRA